MRMIQLEPNLTKEQKISFIKDRTFAELSRLHHFASNYPWEDKDAYVDFISNMQFFLAEACRLLAAAASRCPVNLDQFHKRFVDHIVEERDHEKLVMADLKSLKEELKAPLASIQLLWQSQYYLIEHKNPLALLGCVLYLENLSLQKDLGPMIFDRTQAKFGDRSTSYLRVHVREDVKHVESLFKILDQVPEESLQIIYDSMLVTSSAYFNFFSEITSMHRGKLKKDASQTPHAA